MAKPTVFSVQTCSEGSAASTLSPSVSCTNEQVFNTASPETSSLFHGANFFGPVTFNVQVNKNC